MLLLFSGSAYSQSESSTAQNREVFEIYFEHKDSVINSEFNQNGDVLDRLSNSIAALQGDSLVTITAIEITSSASPEGGRTINKKLSTKRSQALYTYLRDSISVPDSLISQTSLGVDWDGLYTLVEESDMEYKGEVLSILSSVPEETWRRVNPTDRWLTLTDSRNKHLMDLRGGNPYNYMFENIYPQLRRGSYVTLYFKVELPPVVEEVVEVEQPAEVESEPEPEPVEEVAAESEPEIKPLFALKTNLLYDALTAINLELEIPIGDRWSVSGEWIFPWWSSSWKESSNRNSFQLLNGNIEAKYWFGDRTDRFVMTGWHLGLYAGGGICDLEHNAEGYQSKQSLSAGLSAGYAHTIFESKIPEGNLRMEYSLAVGYLRSDYDKYSEHWGDDNTWHTIRQESGTYSWIGPTRAKVSLVWLFNRKSN